MYLEDRAARIQERNWCRGWKGLGVVRERKKEKVIPRFLAWVTGKIELPFTMLPGIMVESREGFLPSFLSFLPFFLSFFDLLLLIQSVNTRYKQNLFILCCLFSIKLNFFC